jgi:3'-5' exoribonuclease
MKNKVLIADLVEGEHIQSVFLVADKSLRTTKSGKPFLALELMDNSGSVDSKIWDEAEAMASRFDKEDFILVEAQVDSWNGQLQLNIRDLQRVDDDDVTLEDFIPASKWDRHEMLQQLQDVISREVKSPEMLRFFDELFDETQLMRQFSLAPAAKGNHHAYLGGLLEHTLSMTRMAVHLTRHYAHYYRGLLNQDLVIAGCVLHDIGKCFELSFGRSFDYTTEGQLVGHIVQGVELISAIAGQVSPPLPAEMIMQLKHLVLSHHGKKDFGSPVRPKTPEAMLLHQLDMIDSRMNMVANITTEHHDGVDADSEWTGYQRLFQERLYMGASEGTNWAKVKSSVDDFDGPGAVPDPANPGDQPRSSREREESGESAPNLDLFPD